MPPRAAIPWSAAAIKLQRKHVDFIVANDITRADAGFEVDTNEVTIVSHDSEETIDLTSKADVASRILDRAELSLKAQGWAQGVNPLAEHLKFYQELGVTGINRDRTERGSE